MLVNLGYFTLPSGPLKLTIFGAIADSIYQTSPGLNQSP